MLSQQATLRLEAAAKALRKNPSELILEYIPVVEHRNENVKSSVIEPTAEQKQIISCFTSGKSCDVDARSGTGKSTTLFWCAEKMEGRGLYVAHNVHTVRDAETKLPKRVETRTINSIGYRCLNSGYKSRLKNNITSQEIIETWDLSAFDGLITQLAAANLIRDTVTKFCHSNAPQIQEAHIDMELISAFQDDIRKKLIHYVIAYAKDMFNEMLDEEAQFPVNHDFYIKLMSINKVKLPYDYIMLDEAQDWTSAQMSIIDKQKVPIIRVGDIYQNLYSWKSSGNSYVSSINKKTTMRLTRSFRFGNQIAKEANRILKELKAPGRALLDEEMSVETLSPALQGTAIICRTVTGMFCEYISGRCDNIFFNINKGDSHNIASFGKALVQIYNGEQPSHPLLMTHRNWQELMYWANQHADNIMREAIMLVDELGPIRIQEFMSNIMSDEGGNYLVSVNRCKGLEYEYVRIGPEFLIDSNDTQEYLTQKYVAYTRGVKRVQML